MYEALPDGFQTGRTRCARSRLAEIHTVTRLVPGSDGRIDAAELKDLNKNAHTFSAPAYIVACGGVESARLLLNSRSEQFPNGMGNRHDLVGRFFTEHPNIEFQAEIERSSSALPFAS